MRYSKKSLLIIFLVFSVVPLAISGCGHQKINVQDLLNQPIEKEGNFNRSKKYMKAGITVVYLTGTPYEIGYAHGKLCKDEIINVNKIYWDYYDHLKKLPDDKWLPLSQNLERYIPEEYILEMANREMARIKMKDGYLTMANHACIIPSKNITYHSVKRLDLGENFLKENLEELNIEKAIDLVRTSRITWYWNPTVHNRQSIIFSPTTLDYWIAIPSNSNYKPASYGPYIGFNLRHELYGSGDGPNPSFFPLINRV